MAKRGGGKRRQATGAKRSARPRPAQGGGGPGHARAGLGPGTLAVHAGETGDPATGAVNVPVTMSTTYRYPELADGSRSAYIYTRYTNPSMEAVESKVAALEDPHGRHGANATLFASGMAAIHAVCASTVGPGATLAVQRGVYGGTTAYLRDELARTGVTVVPFDAHAEPRSARLPKGTRLVWVESITNPMLRVADVRAWAEAAHDAGALLAVDATFATPVLQRPLDLGADVVVHSATKYLSGHSDVTAGVATCRPDLREDVWLRRRNQGSILDPHAAYLVGRGMRTLAIRMERHQANARALAQAALDMPGVKAVHYPGLESHPDHEVAKAVLSGFGGMLTLDLGSTARAQAFRRRTRLFLPASSLGGVESLVSLPLETSHAYVSAAARRADGITPGLVRLSVGIEDAADLVEDVRQALAGA